MDYENLTQLAVASISSQITGNISELFEDFTVLPGDDLAATETDEQSFFKPGLTAKKFFNVSIPIEEKIDFESIFPKRNITNEINKLDLIPPIPASTNFLLFLCSLLFAMFWVTYITFFNSRLVGSFATKIANRFLSQSYPGAYFKVGSLSFSVLAGKIMFRDILFLTPDWSFRSQDGYLIFRWWRSYVPKDVSEEDLSHSDTRLSVQFNGFELHTYNRSGLYKSLEEKFGLEPGIIPQEEDSIAKDGLTTDTEVDPDMDSTEYVLGKNWRDLIPVIKVDISTGKFIFGNRLLPTTLLITMEEAHFTYSTKPATCNLDHFMHTVKTKAENVKVVLAESPKYVGLRHDEAPRYMGDGFVVLASNTVNLYYYMDQAGRVPETQEMLCLASGEMVEPPSPIWGLDIQCGRGTDFSYGPWADRQRELLYKFFFPPDFQPMVTSEPPQPGDLRVAKKFDIKLNTSNEATIDILFSKQKETRAIHMNISPGSFFDMSIPWVLESEDGYTSKLNGTLMNPEATTSLAYRDFIQCETLEFQLDMVYPKFWNDYQEWIFTFTVSKATVNFIFAHKWFFQDMVEDWAGRGHPDILSFVPYTWKFKFIFKEFELLTAANEYNWIDTSSNNPENAHLAICGKLLSLDFSLPYTEFLPDVVPFMFKVSGERLDLSAYLPDTNTSHDILFSLDNSAKIVGRDGDIIWKKDLHQGKWRRRCLHANGWIDCWCVPSLALSIEFLFHPCPMSGPPPQADITTPDKESSLLHPLRPVGPQDPGTSSETLSPSQSTSHFNFDPTTFEPDVCKVDLEVGPSVAFLYGTLIRNFMHVKENLFGEDQKFTPMDDSDGQITKTDSNNKADQEADLRDYRPLSVVLDINVHDLQAHLMKYCTPADPPCPFLCVEKLVFEMDKTYRETRLQLLLSPVLLSSSDLTERDEREDHLKAGNMLLTGLQFRGHAMFSEIDRPLGDDTLEYAWLMEVQCGTLVGKITVPQLYNITMCLETLLYITVDKENVMKHPRPYKICQHNLKQTECIESHKDIMCPTVDDVKYTMLRFNVDMVDVHIVEKVTAIRLQSCPIRVATCNLHGQQTNRGITAILNNIQLHQYISSNMKVNRLDSTAAHHSDIWVEAGAIKIGPIYVEGAFASYGMRSSNFQINQHCFLQKHDRKTKKLWFLWPSAITKVSPSLSGKCGCSGGCNFFGNNENGQTFFKPSKTEISSRVNVALLTLKNRRSNPGYGQSLIHEDYLVLGNCLSYVGNYKILTEGSLPASWPKSCQEPGKLPACAGFKQPKSVLSNTSSSGTGTGDGTTPRTLRRQRTLGRRSVSVSQSHVSSQGGSLRRHKSGAASGEPVKRFSGIGKSGTLEKEPLQKSSSGSNVDVAEIHRKVSLQEKHQSSASLAEINKQENPALMRTESLVSDTLSFYSFDGEQSARPSEASSPKSPRQSMEQESGRDKDKDTISNRTDTPTLAYRSPEMEEFSTEPKSSLSRSVSSTSFMSATSEQEDFGLVNLHMQVNKPITESPLLMSSYISHLTQLRCRSWENKIDSMTGKGPHSAEFYGSVFEQFPCYEMISEGFSCIKMYDKDQEENNDPIPTPSHPQGFTWGSDMFSFDDTDSFSSNDQQTLMNSLSDSNTSKTTMIVKLRDSIDVIASPILLESLQRYIEAITPTVELLHPLTVINHLQFSSLDRVEEKNTLKKEKSLDLQDKILTTDSLTSEKKVKKSQGPPLQSVTRTFEKSVSSSIQGSLFLPKINIMILQASVVEEICAFSALDNVKDITCVSFLALGIQETSFKIHKTSQSKKTVQVLSSQNNKIPLSKKRKSKYKKIAQLPLGTLAFESSETQLEEIIMTGSINKVHAQLRRLKNDSSLLKDASITAIPDHRSQVFFEYLNVPKFGYDDVYDLHESQESFGSSEIHPLGFNMCEAGLEGIQLKVSKKSSNKEHGVKELDDEVKIHEEDERVASPSREVSEEPDTPDLEIVESPMKSPTVSLKSPVNSQKSPTVTLKDEPLPTIHETIENVAAEGEEIQKDVAVSQGKSSKAAANLNVKNVWFNFAAPPKTPITRKIDFTKLDWNLLSTGSPGIDAWLNPFDRVQHAASTMIDRFNCRVGAIMASVMAEALDEQQVHIPKVSKYENLTALAKTLKEDPSCQLCSALKRYVFKKGIEEIETNLDPKVIPPLTTLRQGIVVLSRQWKNVIYTPILIQYNMKTSGMKNLYQQEMNLEQIEETDETSDDEEGFSDIDLDEETLLIKNNSLGRAEQYKQEGSIISNLSFLKGKSLRSPQHQRSPNSEDILALLENGNKYDSGASDDSGAVRSYKSDKLFSGPSSPAIKKTNRTQVLEEEDLYNWMRRQQQNDNNKEKTSSLENKSPREGQTEKSVHIQIEDDVKSKHAAEQVIRQANSGNSFLDAHIIFEPILSSLGLMPQQITNLSLKNLGSQVVVGGGVDAFKIDIVESEIGKVFKKGKVKFPKMTIDPDSHSPAFICEKIVLHLDFKKITDILKGEKPSKDKVMPLYVSRNQLKRHTSSFANFSIEVDIISQKVNMPLLRLLNQIVTMHLNVKETSEELKEKKPVLRHDQSFRRHKKTSSGSSTSDVGSMTLRPDELSLIGSSVNLHSNSKDPPVSRLSHVVQTPSPSTTLKSSIKARPKGFASKFRPNSRLGGYSSLGESPMQEQHDSFILGGHPLEKITEEQVTKCWRTVYHLLDLYATLPETKIVAQRTSIPNLVTPAEISIIQKSKMKYAAIRSEHVKTPDATVKMTITDDNIKSQSPLRKEKEVSFARSETGVKEHMPLIVTGEAKINKVNLTATLSGLRLEGEINGLGAAISYKEKVKAIQKGVNVEASVTGNMKETSIALLEGVPPSLQTVVRLTVGPTETNYTSHMWKTKDKNQGHLSIGPVHVDIPQHPVMLHGIMTRSTKQITNTLMEFKGTRILYKGKTAALDDSDLTQHSSPKITEPVTPSKKPPTQVNDEDSNLIKPLVMKFQLSIESFAVSAALLPSLQAQYKMENVTSKGVTGSKANFNIILPKHTLSFNTKLEQDIGLDHTLPSEASIDLPRVYILAEYMQDESVSIEPKKAADGSMYSKGNYFKAKAEIGELDHCLTTDMLNHLVFVQKVFMKEVNEVVQKMTGGDRLVSVWTDFGEEFELHHSTPGKQLLYTVSVELKRITITATTPSNSAVRFETGTSELVLSNRISNVQGSKYGSNKISFKAKIHLKLSLGQLIKDVIYPEAESQFQQHAYFKTSIQLRNALEDEEHTDDSNIPDKEVILITLNRPLIFLQPIAVDKAILVWLSYKNAWEYWAEQRSSLNKEVLIATQQVIERVPISQLREQISSQHIGTLFLQLNVTDIGVAIPITTDSFGVPLDSDSKGAIVCTVETTSISACSATSVASKGKFEDLCVRFCEDFNHTLDEWKPDRTDDNLLNLCNVSEGSYEVCSKTSKPRKNEETGNIVNAKWILNIQWQMTGVEVQVDTDIGKNLTALGHTLTLITGDEEEQSDESSISDDLDDEMVLFDDSTATVRRQKTTIQIDNLPDFVFDPNIEPSMRTKMMEREMIEQSKIIEDLRKLGASEQTVSSELKKLSDMEAFASKDFRRDIIQKIRRQSARTQSIKEKFGLGSGNAPQVPPQRGISIMKTKAPYPQSPADDAINFEQSIRSRLESEAQLRALNDQNDLEVERTFSSGAYRERKKAIFKSKCDTIDEDSQPSSPGSPRDDNNKSKTGSIISERLRGTVSPKQQPMASNMIADKKSSEPNVDFEFDFKIFINSGKCVLHAKSEESKSVKKDKNQSSSFVDNSSPLSNRKTRHASDKDRLSVTNSRIRPNLTTAAVENSTVFFIPGLDVKVHYVSKTESDYEISFITSEKQDSFDSSNIQRESHLLSMTKKNTNKKATLTTWMTLQSIPEETVISPAILEFLEQALEPLPVPANKPSSQEQMMQGDSETDGTGAAATLATSSYSSFPVDVIVYFHMKSNRFRFSCLPVSRIECMLTLPSLDLVFSSKRADADIAEDVEEAEFERMKSERKNDDGKKDIFDTDGANGGGGLSVTGCLSDFSMHVFHPYGGARKIRRDESVSFSPPNYYDSDRKDSLSVNVAFVKFHLSRTRRLTVVHVSKDNSKLPKQSSDPNGKASIRFSTIVDIGKATFSYDMRRLTEILAFPKAWYRRTLVRRLFLGELKTTNIYTDVDSPADIYDPVNPHMQFNVKTQAQDSPVTPHAPFISTGRKSSVAGTPTQKRQSITLMPEPNRRKSTSPPGTQQLQSWETLVLFAIKFKELEVGMNMGNVMGNVLWVSKDFTSEGRLSIGSSGHKNISIGLGLEGSSLEAKGGIIGGCIDIGKIDTFLKVLEDSGVEPQHKLGARLDAMEVRFDYMGTSVLMGRVSSLKINLKNEWQVGDVKTMSEAGSTRAAMVFVFGDLQWDQFQLMISKSTTADLLKIYYKLEEFFVQQFKSSKRVLSILEPWSAGAAARDLPSVKLGKRSSASFRSNSSQTVSHHRHWQHALEFISGLKIKTMPFKLPTSGAILGGTLELSGKHISLACFHGINFKAKSWALFSMKDPFISFNSEAQGVQVEGDRATNVVQNLVFSLGMGEPIPVAQHVSMATVNKISRNYMYSPQFKILSEWFSYAFHSSSLDQVDRFPVLGGHTQRPSQTYRDKGVYNQTNEIIFALPCLRMDLKTDHIQGERPPSVDDGNMPHVDCSFVTDFEDHIFVTVDAEAFFFLHDLISSYIKEKEKFVSSQASTGTSTLSPHTHGDLLTPDSAAETSRHSPNMSEAKSPGSAESDKSGEADKKPSLPISSDWRIFECKTWHLEPTVRLQSWAGKKIEPYGVDYILQKLGFAHAKTTIPKWMQRGFMDPLDKILSVIVMNAIIIVSQDSDQIQEETRRKKISGIVSKSESFGKKH